MRDGHPPGVRQVVAAGLLIVNFLDHPYRPQIGRIQPTAMRHTLVMMQALEPDLRPGCTQSGQPL
jgi:hypothetical protein